MFYSPFQLPPEVLPPNPPRETVQESRNKAERRERFPRRSKAQRLCRWGEHSRVFQRDIRVAGTLPRKHCLRPENDCKGQAGPLLTGHIKVRLGLKIHYLI